MKIKAEVCGTGCTPPTYPCIKYSERTGRVILFTAPKTGVQLNNVKDDSWGPGHRSDSWCEDDFNLVQGPVTLRNGG